MFPDLLRKDTLKDLVYSPFRGGAVGQLIENDDMDQKSQCKVMAAGFRIIRADDYPQPRIKFKDAKTENWKTLAKFETKAARDRSMEQL